MLYYLVKINNLFFIGMRIPFHNPFCTVSAIHLDEVRSICSVMKPPTGMVYNEIQAAYIGLGIVGYFCI